MDECFSYSVLFHFDVTIKRKLPVQESRCPNVFIERQLGYFKAWHEKDAQSGDKRDFNTWMEVSGLDSFIRGKAVGQWPDFPYTTEQGTIVNKMMGLLAPVQGIGALNETARKMFR